MSVRMAKFVFMLNRLYTKIERKKIVNNLLTFMVHVGTLVLSLPATYPIAKFCFLYESARFAA
jgi:hypothetical protein